MCCLFLVLVILGPRFVNFIWWIAEPLRWQSTFESAIWPILGIIFLPWTLLMYVLVYWPDGQVTGFEWVLVGLAVVCDIATWTGGGKQGYDNREMVPGYPTSSGPSGSEPVQPVSSTPSMSSSTPSSTPSTPATPAASSTPSTPPASSPSPAPPASETPPTPPTSEA